MANTSSAIAVLAAGVGAIVTSVVPSLHVTSGVQATIIGVAGLLTALHVHLSRLLPGKTRTEISSTLTALAKVIQPAPTPPANGTVINPQR
jgi:hypothetical protein